MKKKTRFNANWKKAKKSGVKLQNCYRMKNFQCQFDVYHYFEVIMCIFCIYLRTK